MFPAPHVLFVVEKPANDERHWKEFCDNLDKSDAWPEIKEQHLTKPEQRLSENIWLIPLKTDLPFLAELVSAAKPKFPCKFVLLADAPQWICLGQKTPAIPAAESRS
jgi:hypothetical protein